jgi:hypothetical protein
MSAAPRPDDHLEPEPLAPVPTAEGHYLHEPDGFPHRTMAVLGFMVFLIAGIALVVTMRAALVAAVLAILLVPWLVWRLSRTAHTTRRTELDIEQPPVDPTDPKLVPEHRDHIVVTEPRRHPVVESRER